MHMHADFFYLGAEKKKARKQGVSVILYIYSTFRQDGMDRVS
jgi:hypothetical protein